MSPSTMSVFKVKNNYFSIATFFLVFTITLVDKLLVEYRENIQKLVVETYNCSSIFYGTPAPGSDHCDPETSMAMTEQIWYMKATV